MVMCIDAISLIIVHVTDLNALLAACILHAGATHAGVYIKSQNMDGHVYRCNLIGSMNNNSSMRINAHIRPPICMI